MHYSGIWDIVGGCLILIGGFMIRKVKSVDEKTHTLTYEKSTPKIWAQDLLMDLISTYNYRLENRGMHSLDGMTKKEEEECMRQLKKQADRIAKLFGFDKHWTT